MKTEEELKLIAAQLRKPHGDHAQKVADMMVEGNASLYQNTLPVLNLSADEHILELGMANGYFVPTMFNIEPSIQYTGLDFSPEMVEEAKRNMQNFEHRNSIRFVCGDMNSMPFIDASFDCVFTVNTIYFWEESKAQLAEIKRVLKPEGRLVIAGRPKHIMDEMAFADFGFEKYTSEKLHALLTENDFLNVEVQEIPEPSTNFNDEEFVLASLIGMGRTK
ncbi:MAG: ubiquinone/menaquinone biosynthesis C-methylase UbiE [Bacteroidia bacterium]|jgi:ubiquinone/menaquinone biosynthesis C-methylase UbiE